MNNKTIIGISMILVIGLVYTISDNLETKLQLQNTQKQLTKSNEEIKNFQEIIPLIKSGGLDTVKEAVKHSEPFQST